MGVCGGGDRELGWWWFFGWWWWFGFLKGIYGDECYECFIWVVGFDIFVFFFKIRVGIMEWWGWVIVLFFRWWWGVNYGCYCCCINCWYFFVE